jgi:hypothetical protein
MKTIAPILGAFSRRLHRSSKLRPCQRTPSQPSGTGAGRGDLQWRRSYIGKTKRLSLCAVIQYRELEYLWWIRKLCVAARHWWRPNRAWQHDADARDRRAAAMGCMAQLGYNRGAKELVPRRPARFAEADIGRILEAARKARVQVRLELSHNGASALASVQAFEGRNIDGRFRQNRGAPGVIARCTPVS